MKNHRFGQAEIWTENAIRKMRQNLNSSQQKLIFEISLYTGERLGAIVQLNVADVYAPQGEPLPKITFSASTRKASKHGSAQTRQVKIHADLHEALLRYYPPSTGYLFPSESKSGHITYDSVYQYWAKIFKNHNLAGYSTHSSRRWVINQLRKNGVKLLTIAETMGMDIQTVRHYCDNDPEACENAIATLKV